jgi:four helix bundle protein
VVSGESFTKPSKTLEEQRMPIQSYQDLEVWQKGMDLAEHIYRITSRFPKEELYGLTSQLRRAAISIPANIAEGWARRGTKEFLQFLNIAAGSLREVETLVVLACRIRLIPDQEATPPLQLIQALSRQMLNLQRSLRQK